MQETHSNQPLSNQLSQPTHTLEGGERKAHMDTHSDGSSQTQKQHMILVYNKEHFSDIVSQFVDVVFWLVNQLVNFCTSLLLRHFGSLRCFFHKHVTDMLPIN